MKSLSVKLGVIFSYILIIMVFFSLISCKDSVEDYLKNEVTVYPVKETDKGFLPLNQTKFKVFPESQIVIYWYPASKYPSQKLANCSVRDRLNWSGEFKDGSGKFMMVNGNFSQTFPVNKKYQYVSRWKWWFLKISWMFK